MDEPRRVQRVWSNPGAELPINNAKYVTDCRELHLANRGITDLRGFDNFCNLESLWLNGNRVRIASRLLPRCATYVDGSVAAANRRRARRLLSHAGTLPARQPARVRAREPARARVVHGRHSQLTAWRLFCILRTLAGPIQGFKFLRTLTAHNNALKGLDDVLALLQRNAHLEYLGARATAGCNSREAGREGGRRPGCDLTPRACLRLLPLRPERQPGGRRAGLPPAGRGRAAVAAGAGQARGDRRGARSRCSVRGGRRCLCSPSCSSRLCPAVWCRWR